MARGLMKPLAGGSGLFLDLIVRIWPRRRSADVWPAWGHSSLCGRPAGRCLGKMSGEECARLFFRILGRRLVVFEPVAAKADAGGQLSDIETMMDSGINGQSDRRAIWPGMCDHSTALLHRARFIRLADEDQRRCRHRCR